jgi:microsomal dipeptidase-like Zn-dependent dipeptidase
MLSAWPSRLKMLQHNPETPLTIGEHLSRRGWTHTDIDAVLGGNFGRVAQTAWRTRLYG